MTSPKNKIEAKLFNDTSMYQDIMTRSHPEPKGHLRMNRGDRAAQFAPFAALTGYQEAIDQRTQAYARKRYPNAAQTKALADQLRHLPAQQHPQVSLNYFNAAAGFYQSTTATLQEIDWTKGVVQLQDQKPIAIANIRQIEICQ